MNEPICALPECGDTFVMNRGGNKKYCCSSHLIKHHRQIRIRPKVCPQCENIFQTSDYRQKYCSRSCAATINNKIVPKRGTVMKSILCEDGTIQNVRVPVERKTCDRCGIPLGRGVKGSLCGAECAKNKYIEEWLDGKQSGSYANGALSRRCRDFLLEEAGGRCTECGWAEVNPLLDKPILCIDHIDGNWKNNNRINLKVLCYNCHTLTPTFNSLNIGNGAGVRGSGPRLYPGYKSPVDRSSEVPKV